MKQSAIILSASHYLPGDSITSQSVEDRVNMASIGFKLPRGLVNRLSGVEFRHFVSHELSSDLAAQAGRSAISKGNLHPGDIDMLIYASASADVGEPATANIVQSKIGCEKAHVFDIKNACNSFINALDIAQAYISTNRAKNVLVTSGELPSQFINWNIKNRKELEVKFAALTLGDGGAACLIQGQDESARGLLPGKFFSDGSKWDLSTVLWGGTLTKGDSSSMFFESKSRQLMSLVVKTLPGLILKLADEIGWERDDIKLVIPHQVTLDIIKQLCHKLGFPLDRVMITLDRVGNTVAASIPMALSLAIEEGRIDRGDKILLIGGAAGFSAAALPIIY